jgi:hypothetical protein
MLEFLDSEIGLRLEEAESDTIAEMFQAASDVGGATERSGVSGDVLVTLKAYCRIVCTRSEVVLYDSLNMNTFVLSPLLADLLGTTANGSTLESLFSRVAKRLPTLPASEILVKERELLVALILLAAFRTIEVATSLRKRHD